MSYASILAAQGQNYMYKSLIGWSHLGSLIVKNLRQPWHTCATIGQGMKRKFTVKLLLSRKEGADFDHLVDAPEKSHLWWEQLNETRNMSSSWEILKNSKRYVVPVKMLGPQKRSQNPNSLHGWPCGTGSSQGRGRSRSPTRWLESPSQGPPDICIYTTPSDCHDSSLISCLENWKLCN